MVISERQSRVPFTPLMTIIKNPTILELTSIIRTHEDYQGKWITLMSSNSRGTFYEVIDPAERKKLLRILERSNASIKFPGEIIIHRSPKV